VTDWRVFLCTRQYPRVIPIWFTRASVLLHMKLQLLKQSV